MPSNDLQPLLDTQQNQLMITVDEGTAIDSRALALLAINIGFAGFILDTFINEPAWQIATAGISVALALTACILALLPRTYMGAGIDLTQHPEYLGFDREELQWQLLSDTQYAIETNSAFNRERMRYFLAAFALSIISSIMIVLYL
jgi:hypothetical protein